MLKPAILALIRQILTVAGTALVAKGYVQASDIEPVIGAVLIFERGSGGHVGFAIGQDDTAFYVLGGNQSDAVTVARVAKSRLLGARWPATVPPRPQRLPTRKPGEFLNTTNEI